MTREEHIENLKAIASDMPSDKCSDWIGSLMAGINAMEELQAHREAWEKMQEEIDEEPHYSDGVDSYIKIQAVKKIIAEYRPKEGDNNDN